MAVIKCLMCGEEEEVSLFEREWAYSCGICCGFSLCKVQYISNDDWIALTEKLDLFPKIQNNKQKSAYITVTSEYFNKPLINLLLLFYDKIIVNNSQEIIKTEERFDNFILSLTDERIIIPLITYPNIVDGIKRKPHFLVEGSLWEKNENSIIYLYDNNPEAASLYFALKNLSSAVTTPEVEKIMDFSKRDKKYLLRDILTKISPYGFFYDTLWLSLLNYHHDNIISSQFNSKYIINRNIFDLVNLRETSLNSDSEKLVTLNKFIEIKKLKIPSLHSIRELNKIKESGAIKELKLILDKMPTFNDENSISDLSYLQREFDKSLEHYNNLVSRYNQIGTATICGALSTVGGLIGGVEGALLGGLSSTIGSFGFNHLIRKYFSNKKETWANIFMS